MKRYWLSFDLGLRGNYDDLYEWLDKLGAVECGDSVASFETDKSMERIQQELTQVLGDKARVYVIWRDEGRLRGKFILGKRKRSPWAGYATEEAEFEEVEA